MTPSPKVLKGSEQCQDDCTGENFVRKRAVSQIDRKQWGTKLDLDRFYFLFGPAGPDSTGGVEAEDHHYNGGTALRIL